MEGTASRLIQNVLRCYKDQLPAMPLKQLKAVDAITSCRTAARGVSAYECEHEKTFKLIAHSCRHRSCAVCGDRQRREWIEAQERRLLDVPHFHCVFTLPHEYHGLWRYNQKWFVSTFFDVVRSSLMDSLGNEKRHGITPGVLMAMHTWGRQLVLHPHIHCVVTGGGLDACGKWKDTGKFLLPGAQIRALYRGRFQARIKEAFEAGELELPPGTGRREFERAYRTTFTKPWCVRIEPRYAHGKGVLIYLARYLRGGPIRPEQIRRCDRNGIGFVYKDHRDNRRKLPTLEPREFIRRLLQHVPETGQHMVRHYGLYAGACRRKRDLCRAEVGGIVECGPKRRAATSPRAPICRVCGHPLRLRWVQTARPRKANSYRIGIGARYAQRDDEPVTAKAKKTSSSPRL